MLFSNITVIGEDYLAHEHQNIVTDGNTILSVGPDVPADYRGEIYDGNDKVAMPGFFNTHCHVPMTLLRGYGEGLPLDRWLHERVFPFEAFLSDEDVYWGTMLGVAEQLASGVASFSDMYMNMPGIVRAVEETGIKANLSHGCSAFSPEVHFQDVNGWKGLAFLQNYTAHASHDRIVADGSIHSEYTTHEGFVREIAQFCKENKLILHLHLSETQKEHEECKQRHHGMTPTAYMESCGVFQNPTLAAHCVWLEGNDFSILAQNHVTVMHCPSSNLKLGSGIAPIKTMLEHKMRVTIATDGASSNNNLNMLEEINLASIVQKGINHDPLFLDPQQLLQFACRNGAQAQGRSNCGCIKAGNRADIVVYDLDKPHLQPIFDVLANIFYAAQASDICLNMVDGEVLYKNGEYRSIDVERVRFEANRIRDEKLKALSAR